MAISLKHHKHTSARVRVAAAPPGPGPQEGRRHRRAAAPGGHPLVAGTSPSRWSTTRSARRCVCASTWRPTCARSRGDKTDKAKQVGELVAERAKAAGIEGVVFDRAGNKYHGRVAALADGAREGGLTF